MADETDIETHHVATSFASQFETVSGLAQWRKWLFSLLGLSFAVIFLAYLFPENGLENSMYLLIFGFAVASIYKSYQDAVFLNKETNLASSQVQLLTELNDIAEFLEKAEVSVFRNHIESLYTIFLAHPDIKQDNLIEVLHSRLLARNRVVELFASILITLGLVGTILGLIVMMGNLRQELGGSAGGAGDNLIGRLMGAGGPLDGLDTAFYTTLLGALFGGVILRILTSVVDANIMKYTAHLAELTEVNVLPFMRRIADRLEKGGYYDSVDDHGGGG